MSQKRNLSLGLGLVIVILGYFAWGHDPKSLKDSGKRKTPSLASDAIPTKHESTSRSGASVPMSNEVDVFGAHDANTTPARKVEENELGRELLRVFEIMKDKNEAWDKHLRYEQLLGPLVEEASLNGLVEIFNLKTAESETEREQQAIARVMGLKVFEMAVDKGFNAKAEHIIRQLAGSVARQDPVKNQYLDLESTIRIYFKKHPDFFESQDIFRQKLADLGIILDDVKKQGMQNDFGKGVIVGVLTSATVHGKFADVEKWLTI